LPCSGKLSQCQRVPPREFENVFVPGCIEICSRGAEKGARRFLVERFDVQDLFAGGEERCAIAGTYRTHDDDGVIVDPTGQKRNRLLAGLIKRS
jgi:hypothetical protein